jgi:dihydroneopterin aldolase
MMGTAGDRIVLRSIRALGCHGVLSEERDRAQPFEVDLEIAAPLEQAAQSDLLDATIDYGEVIAGVVRLVETSSFQLLEALAGAIADEVLRNPLAAAVTVEVRKVRPPVAFEVGAVGVRLTRDRG